MEKVAKLDYPNNFTTFKNIFISYFLFFLTTPLFFSVTIFPLLLFLSVFDKDLISIYNKTIKQAVKLGKIKVKFTNVQALVGLKQLKNFDEANKRRIRNAAMLAGCLNKNIGILKDDPAAKPTYYFFVILAHDAKSLSKRLLIKGIDTGKYIMRDCAMVCRNDESCVSTQEAIRTSLQIPNYPQLGHEDVKYIAEVLSREL
jgi:dTDP-4-amino-4,6-dideoxygalactose transaminase